MFRMFIHVSVWFAFGTAILRTADVKEEFKCELRYLSWLNPESLTVNWTVADRLNNKNFKADVAWYTDRNEGTCGESSLTTCTWYHGKNGVYFYAPFSLNIIITDRRNDNLVLNTTFVIDPLVNCSKPPMIDTFTISSMNSTCVQVEWGYNNTPGCSVIDTKLYRISYLADISVDTAMKNEGYLEESTASCKGNQSVCELHPFTTYIFAIQTKIIDYGTTGHFSDRVVKIMKTSEQAPAVAPGLTDGSWSYDNHECKNNNDRAVSLFWKDVPENKKYGDITHFIMTTRDHEGVTEYSFPGYYFSGVVNIKCDRNYMITMRAANTAGVSPRSDTITIPPFVSKQANSIERVIPELSGYTFHVFWHPREATKKYTVLWCLKHIERHCKSSVNWTAVSNDEQFISIPRHPDELPHQYEIAVTTEADGAVWADCFYVDSDIPAPNNVNVKRDTSMSDGSMVVNWYNFPCKEGPYIHVFHIYICEVESEDKSDCLNLMNTITVDGRTDLHVFHNLEPGAMYKVQMKAIGLRNRTSTYSKTAFGKATQHDTKLSHGIIALIVIVCVVMTPFAGYAIYRFNIRVYREWLQYKVVHGEIREISTEL